MSYLLSWPWKLLGYGDGTGSNHSPWTLLTRAQLETDIQIGDHVKVNGFIEGLSYGSVIWLGKYCDVDFVGLTMDNPSDVYNEKMDQNLNEFVSKCYPENTYFVDLSQVQKGNVEGGEYGGKTRPSTSSTSGATYSGALAKVDDNASAPNGDAAGSGQLGKMDDNTSAPYHDAAGSNQLDKASGGTEARMSEIIDEVKKKVTNVETGVEYFTIILQQVKDDLYKRVRNEIAAETRSLHTEIEQVSVEVTKVSKVTKTTIIDEIQNLKMSLARLMKNEQAQRKAEETKHFRILVFIITLLIAWFVRETIAPQSNTHFAEEVAIDDSVRRYPVIIDELGEMAVKETLCRFDYDMGKMQSKFPDKSGRFWSSIIVPIRRIIQEIDPPRPAVILIATTRSHRTAAESLSRELALLVETLHNMNDHNDDYLTLEAAELNLLNTKGAKSQMDHALSDNYRRQHRVAVLHDLGSLPATAATLLHAYCDHESAHFKKVVLLATVYMETEMTFSADDVESYLFEVWHELEEDILKPLISRVANNIAIMEHWDTSG